MGIGWIFISFGVTTVILYLLAKQAGNVQWQSEMATMMVGSLVVGAVMFGAGYLLTRVGRDSSRSTPADRSIA
jgi:ABC-type transport system involved in multi-copper enzyme maturation permease subunit